MLSSIPMLERIFINHNIPLMLALGCVIVGIIMYTFFGHVISQCTNKLMKDRKTKVRKHARKRLRDSKSAVQSEKMYPGYTEPFMRRVHAKDIKEFRRMHHQAGTVHLWTPIIE